MDTDSERNVDLGMDTVSERKVVLGLDTDCKRRKPTLVCKLKARENSAKGWILIARG